MIIEEKLNPTQYLARRENAGWSYRIVVDSTDDLEIGQSYNRGGNAANVTATISLCEVCANLAGYEYDDDMFFNERQKESALDVLRGEITIEEYQEYYQ